MEETLAQLQLKEFLDRPPFCPGIRRGFVILDFVERAGEAATDARDRMGHIIKTVNSAQFNAKGMKPEAKLWCSANRGPQERQRPAHASRCAMFCVMQGKILGAWVNVTALAEALKEPVGEIAQLWESYMTA